MKTLYDVQQLLKQYGIIVYVGSRLYDIEMMGIELKNLHEAQLINDETYQQAWLILKREHRIEMKHAKEEQMNG